MTPLWLCTLKLAQIFLQCAVHSEQRMGEERCEIWYLGHESKPLVNIFPLTFWPSHFAVKIWNEGGLQPPPLDGACVPPRRRDDKPFELALDDNDASRLLYTILHNGKNLVKLSVFYLFLNSFWYIFFYQKRENNCMDIFNFWLLNR